MGIISRIFNMGKSSINNALDNMEDPIALTKQGIEELRGDLTNCIKARAEIRVLKIKVKSELDKIQAEIDKYNTMSRESIKQIKVGSASKEDCEKLAIKALNMKKVKMEELRLKENESEKVLKSCNLLDRKIDALKMRISTYEGDLRLLSARSRVSETSLRLSESMSKALSSNATISKIEKVKDKVMEQEALAEAYSEENGETTSLDEEFNQLVGGYEQVNPEILSELDDIKSEFGLAIEAEKEDGQVTVDPEVVYYEPVQPVQPVNTPVQDQNNFDLVKK